MRALLASNPLRDIPASDAPKARQARASALARAVFLWPVGARRGLERKYTEKARPCW